MDRRFLSMVLLAWQASPAPPGDPRHAEPSSELHEVGKSTELQKLTASNGTTLDYLGSSISVNADRALIGAPRTFDSGGVVSSAYLFRHDGTQWVQEQKVNAKNGALDDQFGYSVSLGGDHALIGAPLDDRHRGAVYVFRFDGTLWIQQQKLLASDGEAGDGFGRSISLSVGSRADWCSPRTMCLRVSRACQPMGRRTEDHRDCQVFWFQCFAERRPGVDRGDRVRRLVSRKGMRLRLSLRRQAIRRGARAQSKGRPTWRPFRIERVVERGRGTHRRAASG